MEFTQYINEELEELCKYVNDFKNDIQRIIEGNSNDPEFRDSMIRYELLTPNLDRKFLHSLILLYVDEIKAFVSSKSKSKSDDQCSSILFHANEVLDIDNLEELFEKNLDFTLNLSNQEYFHNMQKCNKDKLIGILQNKLAVAKQRQF